MVLGRKKNYFKALFQFHPYLTKAKLKKNDVLKNWKNRVNEFEEQFIQPILNRNFTRRARSCERANSKNSICFHSISLRTWVDFFP